MSSPTGMACLIAPDTAADRDGSAPEAGVRDAGDRVPAAGDGEALIYGIYGICGISYMTRTRPYARAAVPSTALAGFRTAGRPQAQGVCDRRPAPVPAGVAPDEAPLGVVRGGAQAVSCPLGLFPVRNTPLLVATDLDGTIVRSDGTISPRTVAAFARVEEAGARFVLVTGRPPRVMDRVAEAFGRRGIAICSNGAVTYDMHTGAITAGHLISPADLAAAAKALREAVPGIGIAVERPDGMAADHVYQAVLWDKQGIPVPRHADAGLFAAPAAKLLGRHMGYSPDELLAIAGPLLDGLVCVTHSSGTGLIEATALGVSKATAVAGLAASHGIGRQAVVAFGDMPNDLPLLSWAGTSCAVANAHPDVLAAATHVIGGNDADGVAAYLEGIFG